MLKSSGINEQIGMVLDGHLMGQYVSSTFIKPNSTTFVKCLVMNMTNSIIMSDHCFVSLRIENLSQFVRLNSRKMGFNGLLLLTYSLIDSTAYRLHAHC